MCTNHCMVVAWSSTGPSLRKKYKMTNYGHTLGNLEMVGVAGPKATRNGNTTPRNSESNKVELCRAETLGGTITKEEAPRECTGILAGAQMLFPYSTS